jgi:DNA (cytosine-5)-methyltransferase 1
VRLRRADDSEASLPDRALRRPADRLAAADARQGRAHAVAHRGRVHRLVDPCPSIFERKKALADNTLRRIARGIKRYVIDSPKPFIIQTGYGEDRHRNGGAGQPPRALDIEAPLGTVVGGGVKHALCAAFLAKHYGGHETPGASLRDPVSTITTQDHHHLVASSLVKLKGTAADGQAVDTPLHTVQAGGTHYGEVRAFLCAYYGNEKDGAALVDPMRTLSTRDRFGLVTVAGIEYAIADIGMRMLQPRELYRAQGFTDSYKIDIEYNGKPLSKTAQVRMCGNSVCPPLAAAIIRANLMAETFTSRERVA